MKIKKSGFIKKTGFLNYFEDSGIGFFVTFTIN